MDTRKKQFLMVIPVFIVPMLCLLFYAGGGGGGTTTPKTPSASGLNEKLPDAALSDKPLDKFSMYEQARKDSDRLAELAKNDGLLPLDPPRGNVTTLPPEVSPYTFSANPPHNVSPEDNNERKVREKLAELDRQLHATPAPVTTSEVTPGNLPAGTGNAELQQAELLMQNLMAQQSGDPELNKLDGMLDKLLDIQHPQRLQEKLKQQSLQDKQRVFRPEATDNDTFQDLVAPTPYPGAMRLLPDSSRILFPRDRGQFYDLNSQPDEQQPLTAFTAVVHATQSLVSGAQIQLRLTQAIYINATTIPVGSFVYGQCSLNGERLMIAITSITYRDNLFPVNLTVYDGVDGQPGIHIPGAITRDVAKQESAQALQGMQLSTLDPSLAAQATSAGIETVKTLVNRKTRLTRVAAKAGHPVLLVDNRSN